MKLHLFANIAAVQPLLDWLQSQCGIGADGIGHMIHADDEHVAMTARFPSAQLQAAGTLPGNIAADDAIIVAGEDIAAKIAFLFNLGLTHVYDGNLAMKCEDPVRRLQSVARQTFVGSIPPTQFDPGASDALRFHREAIRSGQVGRHLLFIVNSLPKSGSMWLAGMLAHAMGLQSADQMVVSHVADIESDAAKWNVHGAVVLVRDMRDVVVSWYHDVQRNDLRSGFAVPRYADLDSFYREFFLGTMRSSDRYYRGDILSWVDRACASYVPLIRYEDMLADPARAVGRILNAWRVDHGPEQIVAACSAWNADSMRASPPQDGDRISLAFGAGHLRRGVSGAWKDELPAAIARDIEVRFRDYQERLGYG
ncbi:sulfotransferase domain-containing protein [Sphingobium sp. B2]|uniref:sulfotransferase domain-containing protein n=1 Tax=Sphingobium sp. B2 TaxID=2583228 RepID=UPI001643B5C8|nr:sulfotransferase domain-containing protein [Sphingobium sp. B2]